MGHKKQKHSKIFFVFAFLLGIFSLNILPAFTPAPTSNKSQFSVYADDDDETDGDGEGDSDDDDGGGAGGTTDSGATCYTAGTALSWIICPIIEGLIGLTDWIYNDIITNYLRIDTNMFSNDDNSALMAWQYFQSFANILFVIFTLVVVFSQVTGIGISNLGIKRVLPRLIVAVILINLSYVICQVLVDVSNILGMSLKNIFDTIPVTDGKLNPGESVLGAILNIIGLAFGVTVTTGVVLAAAPALSTVSVGLVITCVLSLLPAVAGIIVLFALLAARQAGVLILTIIAPVAIVLYMLPNTKKMFDRYIRIFSALLLLYPICGILMGGSDLAAKIILTTAGHANDLAVFVALLIDTVPFFFIPTLVRRSMDSIAGLGTLASNWGNRVGRGAQSRIGNLEGVQSAIARSRAGQTIGRRRQFERDEHGNIKRDASGRRIYKRDENGNVVRAHQRNWSGENRKAISDANIPIMSRAMRRQQVRANRAVQQTAATDAAADAVFNTKDGDGNVVDMTQAAINAGQLNAQGRMRQEALWANDDVVQREQNRQRNDYHAAVYDASLNSSQEMADAELNRKMLDSQKGAMETAKFDTTTEEGRTHVQAEQNRVALALDQSRRNDKLMTNQAVVEGIAKQQRSTERAKEIEALAQTLRDDTSFMQGQPGDRTARIEAFMSQSGIDDDKKLEALIAASGDNQMDETLAYIKQRQRSAGSPDELRDMNRHLFDAFSANKSAAQRADVKMFMEKSEHSGSQDKLSNYLDSYDLDATNDDGTATREVVEQVKNFNADSVRSMPKGYVNAMADLVNGDKGGTIDDDVKNALRGRMDNFTQSPNWQSIGQQKVDAVNRMTSPNTGDGDGGGGDASNDAGGSGGGQGQGQGGGGGQGSGSGGSGGGQGSGSGSGGGSGQPSPNNPDVWQHHPFAQQQGGGSGQSSGPQGNSPETWQNHPMAQQQQSQFNNDSGSGSDNNSGGSSNNNGSSDSGANNPPQAGTSQAPPIVVQAQSTPIPNTSQAQAQPTQSPDVVQQLQAMHTTQVQQANAQNAATQQQTNTITQAAQAQANTPPTQSSSNDPQSSVVNPIYSIPGMAESIPQVHPASNTSAIASASTPAAVPTSASASTPAASASTSTTGSADTTQPLPAAAGASSTQATPTAGATSTSTSAPFGTSTPVIPNVTINAPTAASSEARARQIRDEMSRTFGAIVTNNPNLGKEMPANTNYGATGGSSGGGVPHGSGHGHGPHVPIPGNPGPYGGPPGSPAPGAGGPPGGPHP